jgi:hypothetical protein
MGVFMKSYLVAATLCAASLTAPFSIPSAAAKQRTVVEQLPADIVDRNYVDQVEVIVSDSATKKMAELESKASEKRAEAGLAPFGAEAGTVSRDQYATVPFAAMAPLVMRDVTRKWGLTPERGGKPVNLRVTVESIKTANAGMALLMSSSDELSGEVVVLDPATQQQIGSFYVQVVNSHGGLAGLAMRGAGVREKLVEEFALESSRILTGSTKKDWKKRVKESEGAEKEAAKATGSVGAEG